MNKNQTYIQFPTSKDYIGHLEHVYWKGKPRCPYCKKLHTTKIKHKLRHHCNSCNASFSVTTGTIFHKTKIDLQKWFLGISLVLYGKKSISARQLACEIKVNKNTAWFMLTKIRNNMRKQEHIFEEITNLINKN